MDPFLSPYKYSYFLLVCLQRLLKKRSLAAPTSRGSLVLHYTAMVWRKKSGSESPGASPCYDDVDEKVPRGHVPMVAGCVDGDGERVLVPVRLLRDPCIVELLDMAAQRYGYGQPGVLRIPCDASHFRRVVDCALQRAGQAA